MHTKFCYVRLSHDQCAHAHSLEGTLTHIVHMYTTIHTHNQ